MSNEYIPSSVKLHTSDQCKWSKIKICGFAFVTGFVMALFIAAWFHGEDIEKVTRIRFNEGWTLGSNNVQAGAIIRGFGYRTNKVFVWHKNLEELKLKSRQDDTVY